MRLIPSDLELPKLYTTESDPDPIVPVKLFTPDSSFSFFLLEFDGADLLFAFVTSVFADELGYVSLSELEAVRGPLGLPIERDLWWKPTPLSEVRSGRVR